MIKYILLYESLINNTLAGNVSAVTQNKDNRMLYLILAMAVVFIILVIIIVLYDKRNNCFIRSRKGTFGQRQKWSDRFYTTAYHYLSSFFITRGYIEKIGYQYRLISPCDHRFIVRKTINSCLISWSICLFSFSCVFLFNPRLITLITAGVAIILTDSEVVGRMAKLYEITTLQETQKMIANVEHNFYVEYRVDDALYRSFDNLNPNMKKTAEQIYQLLLSEDKEEALRLYYENVPNKYLRAFVSQCLGVMERGDQVVDGKLLFIRNMDNLQREIDIELDKLKRLQLEFLGVIVCVVAPVFFIDFVKQFAISIKENMDTFFFGKEGFLLDIALLFIIVCIYYIMRKSAEYKTYYQSRHRLLYEIDRIPAVKKAMDNYCNKSASKIESLKRELRNNGSSISPRHFLLRSFLMAGMAAILSIGITCYLHMLSREQLLVTDQADIEVLTSAAKESQYEKMGEVIETFTRRYTLEAKKNNMIQVPDTQKEMLKALKAEGTFYSPLINEALAGEILRRVRLYRQEHLSFLDLFLCFSLSIVTFYIPKLMIKYNSSVSRDAMEDEVNQFNSIICMLMYVDSMTVKQILEEMESFSVVFRQSLRNCINNYSSGDMEALKELREREPYEPFHRLVDNLIRCDDMPIDQAFQEINVERDGYISNRKLANEKSIRKRVFRAYVLAAVPFLLLFSYGLVPTLFSSINEINVMLTELESSSW